MQASNAAALSDQQIKNGKAAEMEYNNNPPMDGYSFGADMDSAGNGSFDDDDINGGYFPASAGEWNEEVDDNNNNNAHVDEADYNYDYATLRLLTHPPRHRPPLSAAYQWHTTDTHQARVLNNEAASTAAVPNLSPRIIIQTPNFRSTFRHHQIHPQHQQRLQSLNSLAVGMNSHTQSELLPANNNSRQQLNNYATPTTSPYNDLHLVANEMNALYETTRPFDQVRDFHQGQLQEHEHIDEPRYPSPPPPIGNNPYVQQPQQQNQQNQQQQQTATPESRGEGHVEPKSESDAPSPGRSKPIIKPERPVTKNAQGLFECDWPGCTEEMRLFARKCEWSKHMDKHDRPYKCPASGCEKLPGFTYSGGLLRHEREVHNKHGGPRKQLNCPHPNCKRHNGKGFSRQENLNEHLRRVHTSAVIVPIITGPAPETATGTEEAQDQDGEVQTGQKRKRAENDEDDIRDELKRLRQENNNLKQELAESRSVQESIQADMQRQLHHLQAAMHLQPRMQQAPAPAATMI